MDELTTYGKQFTRNRDSAYESVDTGFNITVIYKVGKGEAL